MQAHTYTHTWAHAWTHTCTHTHTITSSSYLKPLLDDNQLGCPVNDMALSTLLILYEPQTSLAHSFDSFST